MRVSAESASRLAANGVFRRPCCFGPFRLDPVEQRLTRRGHPVPVTPKAFRTLLVLVSRAGQLVDKDELLAAVWPDAVVEEIGLARNISALRRALGDTTGHPHYIQTVPKRGYRFIATVTQSPDGTDADVPSLAVLPLADYSIGEFHDFLADALADAFTTEIARLPFLRVLPGFRTAGFPAGERASEVGSRLGVQYLLEGSFQRLGTLLRVAVRLVDAGQDRTLWSGSFERQLGNWHVIQAALAQAVASELRLSLRPEDRTRLAPARPVDGAAYEEYLRARHFLLRRTNPALRRAYEGFLHVTQLAPDFAPAYGGLAETCLTLYGRGLEPAEDILPRAHAAARMALELDPTLAEARAVLAVFLAEGGDLDAARVQFEQALRDEPNYALGHGRYAETLRNHEFHDEAVVQVEQALSLEPLSLIINLIASQIFRGAGQFERSMLHARKVVELDPAFHSGHWQLGLALLEGGKPEEAVRELQLADEQAGGNAIVRLALAAAFAAAGREQEAGDVLERLAVPETPPALFLDIARLEVSMGHHQQASAAVERCRRYIPDDAGPLPDLGLRGRAAVEAFDRWTGRAHVGRQEFLPKLLAHVLSRP